MPTHAHKHNSGNGQPSYTHHATGVEKHPHWNGPSSHVVAHTHIHAAIVASTPHYNGLIGLWHCGTTSVVLSALSPHTATCFGFFFLKLQSMPFTCLNNDVGVLCIHASKLNPVAERAKNYEANVVRAGI